MSTPSPDLPHDRAAAIEARQAQLDARMAAIEARIAQLEQNAARQVPWTFPVPASPGISPIWPLPENSDDARCHVCNGRWADMGHYVCHHDQCPSRWTCTLGGESMSPKHLPHYAGTPFTTTTSTSSLAPGCVTDAGVTPLKVQGSSLSPST